MPQRPEDLQVEYALTNLAVLYSPQEFNLAAEQVMPSIPTAKQEGTYWVYDKADRLTLPNTNRGPRGVARGADFGKTKATYATEDYALHALVTDRERNNASTPFDENVSTTEGLIDLLMLDREKRVADMVTSTANITQNTTLTGTNQWSDYSNSNPFSNLKTGRDACFFKPNTAVMSKEVWSVLEIHPDIVERVKYVGGDVTPERVASLLGIGKLIIADAQYNSAVDGQSVSYGSVWGKHVLMCYTRPGADLRRPSFGYTMKYDMVGAGGKGGLRVRTARDEKTGGGATYIEADCSVDEKLVAVDLAYLIIDAVA